MVKINVHYPANNQEDLMALLSSPPYPGVIDLRSSIGGARIVAYPFRERVMYAVFYSSEKVRSLLVQKLPTIVS